MLDALSATVTVATGVGGGTVIVMVAPPVWPSLVARIVAEPAAMPVTRPVLETVATLVLLELHAIARPVSTAPVASRVIAVACAFADIRMLEAVSETLTVATGTGATVIEAVPVLPSLVAVIVAVPAATPLTRPLLETAAIDGSLDVHVTVRPVRTLPLASFVVAVP